MMWWHWLLIGLVVGFFVGYVLSYYQDQVRVKLWLEYEAAIRKEAKRLGIKPRVRPTDTLEQLRAKMIDLQARQRPGEIDAPMDREPAYPPEPETVEGEGG